MNTQKLAGEYRLTHWAKIINDRRESGINVKSYCESIGIKENTFYYWQKKLREAACQQMVVHNHSIEITNNKAKPAPNGWVSCEMLAGIPNDNSIKIEIGKCRITVSSETDIELLTKICRALVAI